MQTSGEDLAAAHLTRVWNKISEKIPSPNLAINAREATRVHSLKSVSRSEGVELSGVNVVLRTSVAARLQKNKFRNGLIKTVVNVGVIHPLILIVHHRDDIEDRSDLCHSPACIVMIHCREAG